jgi:hypothetical protein
MRNTNLTKIAAVIMIFLAMLNFAASFAIFAPGGPQPVLPPEAEAELSPAQGSLIQDVGGTTSPTGIAVFVISLIFVLVAVGLLSGRGWRLGAMMALGADITFKIINIVVQLLVGNPTFGTLPAIAIVIVEIILIGMLWSDRRTYYHDPATERSPEDAAQHGTRTSEQRREMP